LSCSFLICIASLIHLSTLLLSLSMTLAWSQSMTWLREIACWLVLLSNEFIVQPMSIFKDNFVICFDAAPWISYLFRDFTLCWHWFIKHNACLLLHSNESGWPDPDCLDPAASRSGSRSGAPLVIVIATCLSVRLSVTRRYCVKTKKASGISSPSGSPKTLVFWRQISSPNSMRFPPERGPSGFCQILICLYLAGSGSYRILKKHRISIRIQIRCTSSNSDRNVSVRPSVCHAPVLCQNEES